MEGLGSKTLCVCTYMHMHAWGQPESVHVGRPMCYMYMHICVSIYA